MWHNTSKIGICEAEWRNRIEIEKKLNEIQLKNSIEIEWRNWISGVQRVAWSTHGGFSEVVVVEGVLRVAGVAGHGQYLCFVPRELQEGRVAQGQGGHQQLVCQLEKRVQNEEERVQYEDSS